MTKELSRETKIALLFLILAKFSGCLSILALGAATFGYHQARIIAFVCGGLWLVLLIACIYTCILAYRRQKPEYERELYERLKAKYEAAQGK